MVYTFDGNLSLTGRYSFAELTAAFALVFGGNNPMAEGIVSTGLRIAIDTKREHWDKAVSLLQAMELPCPSAPSTSTRNETYDRFEYPCSWFRDL